jgi:hypothetical protein
MGELTPDSTTPHETISAYLASGPPYRLLVLALAPLGRAHEWVYNDPPFTFSETHVRAALQSSIRRDQTVSKRFEPQFPRETCQICTKRR